MGFLPSFFRKLAIIEIQDVVFGTLITGSKKGSTTYWLETDELLFQPNGHTISVTIESDRNEPTQKHRDFFHLIEKKYAALTPKRIPLIEAEFHNWEPGFTINTFETEFRLVYVFIPVLNNPATAWQWAFETVHDVCHALTFSMLDDAPQSLMFDG